MPEPKATTLLEDAIDIPIWLETDASLPLPERRHRDREIARRLELADDAARVRAWWQRMGRQGVALPGRGLDRARSWVNLALALVGVLGGTSLALAAFRYDGSYPINVVRLLALLVAPQLGLLALSLLLIPGRLPRLRFIQDGLQAINPGALAESAYRQLARWPQARIFNWVAAPGAAARRFGKWQMLFWSQVAAVAFNIAVVATAVVLIAFTDLAFGWTTTLDVDTDTASRIFGAIAAPWAIVVPDAVPDQALVEGSRYFRLEGPNSLRDSQVLTGWWSFTVLAVIVYGLIPRCAFLLVAGWRLRAATRALMLDDSRVVALLDRMSAPDIDTGGHEPAAARAAAPPPAGVFPGHEQAGAAAVVIWNQAVAAERAAELGQTRLGLATGELVEAGSGSLDQDRRNVERLAETSGPVVVLTPAWEPPLLEFTDFLGVLRGTIGPSRSIVVVPVGEAMQAITPLERENWSLAVGRTGDPHAYVEPGAA